MTGKYMLVRIDSNHSGEVTKMQAYEFVEGGFKCVDGGGVEPFEESACPVRRINLWIQPDGSFALVSDTVNYCLEATIKVGCILAYDITTDEALIAACDVAWSAAFPVEYTAAMRAEQKDRDARPGLFDTEVGIG